MSENKLGQEPAFPQSFATDITGAMYSAIEKNKDFGGMSKRFYAACAVMQGLLANGSHKDREFTDSIDVMAHTLSVNSYIIADELLRQENL